jgi:hypothetical protein
MNASGNTKLRDGDALRVFAAAAALVGAGAALASSSTGPDNTFAPVLALFAASVIPTALIQQRGELVKALGRANQAQWLQGAAVPGLAILLWVVLVATGGHAWLTPPPAMLAALHLVASLLVLASSRTAGLTLLRAPPRGAFQARAIWAESRPLLLAGAGRYLPPLGSVLGSRVRGGAVRGRSLRDCSTNRARTRDRRGQRRRRSEARCGGAARRPPRRAEADGLGPVSSGRPRCPCRHRDDDAPRHLPRLVRARLPAGDPLSDDPCSGADREPAVRFSWPASRCTAAWAPAASRRRAWDPRSRSSSPSR